MLSFSQNFKFLAFQRSKSLYPFLRSINSIFWLLVFNKLVNDDVSLKKCLDSATLDFISLDYLYQLLNCLTYLLNNLLFSLLKANLLSQLPLRPAIKDSIPELPYPLSIQMISILSSALHEVIFPSSLVFCSIGKLKNPSSIVLIISPLTSVN